MATSSFIQCTGPLVDHLEGLRQELLATGYTPLSAGNLLRLAAHLSRWLEAHRLTLEDLAPSHITAFCRARRKSGYTQFLSPNALKSVLCYLEYEGIITRTMVDTAPASPLESLLHNYIEYLVTERVLTLGVARQYGDCARRFLVDRFGQDLPRLRELGLQDITGFILKQSRHYSTGSCKLLVTALRSFLRYLYLTDTVDTDLASAVPTVAGWRLTGLPKGLDDTEVRRLLHTCDRRTRLGRRDYVLLLLMLRLGLRRCEVAALTLDDIHWRRGELTVRGKGREDPLPLPSDVGEALARYLRFVHPHALDQRRVFPRIRAPFGPLSRGGIGAIVSKRLRQAGVHPPHTHRLRHTAATQMLRQGASLDQIAQVLRHHSRDTTAIYAKVDRQALQAVAQPWSGGAP